MLELINILSRHEFVFVSRVSALQLITFIDPLALPIMQLGQPMTPKKVEHISLLNNSHVD